MFDFEIHNNNIIEKINDKTKWKCLKKDDLQSLNINNKFKIKITKDNTLIFNGDAKILSVSNKNETFELNIIKENINKNEFNCNVKNIKITFLKEETKEISFGNLKFTVAKFKILKINNGDCKCNNCSLTLWIEDKKQLIKTKNTKNIHKL